MFTEFWQLYPTKRDKVKAQKAFNKLSEKDQREAIEGVKREIAHRQKMAIAKEWMPNWSYAQGWINGRRWEDEYTEPGDTPAAQVFDPIAEDIATYREAQEAGHQLYVGESPVKIDDHMLVSAKRSVQLYDFLKRGNQIEIGGAP